MSLMASSSRSFVCVCVVLCLFCLGPLAECAIPNTKMWFRHVPRRSSDEFPRGPPIPNMHGKGAAFPTTKFRSHFIGLPHGHPCRSCCSFSDVGFEDAWRQLTDGCLCAFGSPLARCRRPRRLDPRPVADDQLAREMGAKTRISIIRWTSKAAIVIKQKGTQH